MLAKCTSTHRLGNVYGELSKAGIFVYFKWRSAWVIKDCPPGFIGANNVCK